MRSGRSGTSTDRGTGSYPSSEQVPAGDGRPSSVGGRSVSYSGRGTPAAKSRRKRGQLSSASPRISVSVWARASSGFKVAWTPPMTTGTPRVAELVGDLVGAVGVQGYRGDADEVGPSSKSMFSLASWMIRTLIRGQAASTAGSWSGRGRDLRGVPSMYGSVR